MAICFEHAEWAVWFHTLAFAVNVVCWLLSWLRVQSLALASTVLLMLLSWVIRFSPLMMLSTGAFVMLTISVSILAVLRLVGKGIQR